MRFWIQTDVVRLDVFSNFHTVLEQDVSFAAVRNFPSGSRLNRDKGGQAFLSSKLDQEPLATCNDPYRRCMVARRDSLKEVDIPHHAGCCHDDV